MSKLKLKLMILAIAGILAILTIPSAVYAANENIEMVQQDSNNYLIYIKDNLNTDLKFAFSNDKNSNKDTLIFKKAETDSTEEGANKIAFVDESTINLFKNTTYMWAKDEKDNFILEGIQIDLKKAITNQDLLQAANVTKIIDVDTTKVNTKQEVIDGKTITTTTGKVVMNNKKASHQYVLTKIDESEEYANLMNLATRISKLNDSTDMYTKINVYRNFVNTLNNLKPSSKADWKTVENNEINQPVETVNGEKYILWLTEKDGNHVKEDVQFLTSYRTESEEKAIEKITTKLPVTYDNNTLLIVLAILVLIAIAVLIKIKSLSKKQEN